MPAAPGFAYRSQSAVASGTTSLTIAAPSPAPVDDDALILCVQHEGSGWAVVPAGFSVIGQVLQGTHRLELLWKRASSESGSYSVTGLATFAIGFISVYSGALESGNMLDVVSVNGDPAGRTYGHTDSMSVTAPGSLLLFLSGAESNVNFQSHGTDEGKSGLDPLLWDLTWQNLDPDLFSVSQRVETAVAGGKMVLGDAIKVVAPKPTGPMFSDFDTDPATGCIMAALIPRTTALAGGTTYYPTTNAPPARIDAAFQGSWRAAALGGSVVPGVQRTLRLSQTKSANGIISENGFVTNQQDNYDMVTMRFMSPPLEAQTLSGTFDLRWPIGAFWDDVTLGLVDSSVIRTKVHIYVGKGQTGETRSVLLANHVDATDWPFSPVKEPGDVIGTGLTAPVTLATQAFQDGDCLCIEYGIRVVSSPTPTPTFALYPVQAVDSYTQALFTLAGASYNELSNLLIPTRHAGVPYQDCVAGAVGPTQVPHFLFSGTLVERTPPDDVALPINDTWQTATVITSIPFVGAMVDTTRVPQHQRQVWHSWVPDESGRYLIASYGSNNVSTVKLFEDYGLTPTKPQFASGFVIESGIGIAIDNNLHTQWWDVVAGTQYWISQRVQIVGLASAASSGGATRLLVYKQELPVEDDLYVLSNHILLMDDCGIVKSQQGGFELYTPSGIAIDYGQAGMADLTHADFPAITNFNHRVHIALFGSELVEIVDAFDLNAGRAEVDWLVELGTKKTNITINHLHIDPTGHTDGGGRLVIAMFGNGYWHVSALAIGCGLASAYLSNPSPAATVSDVYARTAGVLEGANQAGSPWGDRPQIALPVEVAAASSVALAPDNNRVLYYTSGAWYWSATQTGGTTVDLRATRIQRWDLDAGVALSDVGTITPVPGSVPGAKGLFAFPSGKGLLVCNGSQVLWMSLTGEILRVYTPSPTAQAQHLTDVKPTHDFLKFWVMDHESHWMFQFDLFSGAQLRSIPVYLQAGVGSGFQVYVPNGYDTICW